MTAPHLPSLLFASCCFPLIAVKVLYGVVLVFGILLALVTLHGFKSVGDPVTPIGILDKLSFIMGVHDKQAVTVLHIGTF